MTQTGGITCSSDAEPAFGGRRGRIDVPQFEFLGLTQGALERVVRDAVGAPGPLDAAPDVGALGSG